MKKILILVLVILIVLTAGGFFYFTQIKNKQQPLVSCDQSPFKGTVGYPPAQGQQTEKDRQYILLTSIGRTYYLRLSSSEQASALQASLGKEAKVSGSLVKADSGDINVASVCP